MKCTSRMFHFTVKDVSLHGDHRKKHVSFHGSLPSFSMPKKVHRFTVLHGLRFCASITGIVCNCSMSFIANWHKLFFDRNPPELRSPVLSASMLASLLAAKLSPRPPFKWCVGPVEWLAYGGLSMLSSRWATLRPAEFAVGTPGGLVNWRAKPLAERPPGWHIKKRAVRVSDRPSAWLKKRFARWPAIRVVCWT